MHIRDERHLELARLSLPRAIIETTIRSQVDVQAAQIAFNAVFSLGPLLAITMTLLSALPGSTLGLRLHDILVPYAPDAVRPFLESQFRGISHAPNSLVLALSVVGLLWTISAATSAISTALGHVGWPLVHGWARQRARAAVLGIVAAAGLVLSAVAASIGPFVLRVLSQLTQLPFERLASVAWLRWPVAGVAFGLASALFVTFGTAQRPRPLAVFWGGVTAGIISVAASLALGFYLSRAPRLGGAYGAAGAVFAALLWLYVLALGLLGGSAVAFVLHVRGPHFQPMITGATHIATRAHRAGSATPAGTDAERARSRIHRRRPHRGQLDRRPVRRAM
jgi:YihY family inner membrane protein